MDVYGNKKLVWVKLEPNHFRSAENYCLAAVKYLRIEEALFNVDTVREMQHVIKMSAETNLADDEIKSHSDYFSRRTSW